MGLQDTDIENILVKNKNNFDKKLKLSFGVRDVVSAYRVNKTESDHPKHVLITLRNKQVENKIYRPNRLPKSSEINT